MATFRKVSLIPDVPLCGTGPGGERVRVQYSPAECAHLSRRLKEMLRLGLQVPVAWEHQRRARPMSADEWDAFLAEKTRLTLGHLTDGEVLPDGRLRLKFDVPDADDARCVERIKYVSPELVNDFIDGSGRLWPGLSITHLAVTPRPVQHAQGGPAERVALSLTPRPNVVRLSLGADMADNKPDDDADDGADDLMTDEPDGDEATPAEAPPPAPAPAATPAVPDPAAAQKLQDVIAAMQALNLHLPPDTTPDNLLDVLHSAVLTAAAHKAAGARPDQPGTGQPGPQDEFDGSAPPPAGVQPPPGNPVMLSLYERVCRDERKGLHARIRALGDGGHLSKEAREYLERQAGAVRLSLDGKGELTPNVLTRQLDVLELNARGLKPNARLSLPEGVAAVDPPTPPAKPSVADIDDEVVTKLSGGRYQKRS